MNAKEKEAKRVRDWRLSKRKPCPDGCGREVAYKTKRCRPCWAIVKRDLALDKTVAEIKIEAGSLRWTDHVRYFSRKMHEFVKCAECGYDTHVEVAHIKDIANFDDNATIREINHQRNVVGLCPNHHWEFDNGHLEFKPSWCNG